MALRFLLFGLLSFGVAAEDGLDAWLRYAPIPRAKCHHRKLPTVIVALNSTENSPVYTAGTELVQGINGIFGLNITAQHDVAAISNSTNTRKLVVGTVDAYTKAVGKLADLPDLIEDGYHISAKAGEVAIVGLNQRGALYGAFEYLSRLARGDVSANLTVSSNPDAPIRWVNQWDNMQDGGTHGSVERGYGGDSIFFWEGRIRPDLKRARRYARLLASIGVNAVVVNNVNANATTLTDGILDGVARIADAFRPYGVQLGLSLNFEAPKLIGGLSTADPLDEGVIKFWQGRTDSIYQRIPDFAGYLVKANSEGQTGPLTYNRTLAQGANMFAKTLKPGAVVMFRAFVYNYQTLNQTANWKADRANAAVEYFHDLDEVFDENVVVQIKYGPIDFQAREPVSPLFTKLRRTRSAVEFQVTQEYLGQQAHWVYIAPMWKELLDFDLRIDNKASPLKEVLNGKAFGRRAGGYAGVVNVGDNSTWLGSHIAMSNLYAYGKLAWNPEQDSVAMLNDWTRLTFGFDKEVANVIADISMKSWPAYENYTGPLGVQTLTNILHAHYGPNPGSMDNNPWGQWTRADAFSIGMDRTVWNGTGFAGQYPPQLAAMWEKVETTPDNYLLWFHHVPYTQVLKSGKTVIQHFYDSHYEGSGVAQQFQHQWAALKGKIDTERFEHVLFRLRYQAGHALVWRDNVNYFYYNMSGIADAKGRVGAPKYRIEAEEMKLDGYRSYRVHPYESASKGHCVVTVTNSTTGTASAVLENVASGTYDLAVNYYDLMIGNSTWEVYVGEQRVGAWGGDLEYILGKAPTQYIDGQTATRVTFPGVKIEKGAILKVVGKADGDEPAPLDYVSILPQGEVD